jgi:hypothetical protein
VSSPIGPGKTVELIEDLRITVRGFKERADRLTDDFRTRIARERLRGQATLDEQGRLRAEALAEAEAARERANTAAEAAWARRKTRISKAYQASQEQGLRKAEDRTGARKYELQKKMLQAARDRENGLARTTREAGEFKTILAAEQETLAELERTAQREFRGYGRLLRVFFKAYEDSRPDLSGDHHQLLVQLRDRMSAAREQLGRFHSRLAIQWLRNYYAWMLLAILAIPVVPLLQTYGIYSFSYPQSAAVAAGIGAVVLFARFLAARRAQPLGAAISDALAGARRLHDTCAEKSEAHYQQELQRIDTEHNNITESVERDLKRALAQAGEMRVACRMNCDEKMARAVARNDRLRLSRLARLGQAHETALAALQQAAEARTRELAAAAAAGERKLDAEYQAEWGRLEAEWKAALQPIYSRLGESRTAAEKCFPPWNDPAWRRWTPPPAFAGLAKFGVVEVNAELLCEGLPKDKRLALPGPVAFPAALSLTYPNQGSLLFETFDSGHDEAIQTLNQIILRLLAVAPPGKLNFSIIDPVGLGQNFSGVMHLADYEEQIINSRIWTQSTQIEQKLAELNEHMEKVIQMYLRNEYATIAEYNQEAGVIAEKYYFLVVADFPVNFTETAAKRLMSIAASGARCGVYMLLHWDRRQPNPAEFIPDELRKSCFSITCKNRQFLFTAKPLPGAELVLDEPPTNEFAIELVRQIGLGSRDSSRVEVPFEHVAPAEAELWSEETTGELRVPIGRTGATKLQYLAIGKGTCQHGLIAGKTGSGKSTLFHVIITNLSLWCGPDQVEFYLVDFKKGVEFKCYAEHQLPHARVVAIESDREFGLSVLQRVDDELRRRGDLFRKRGVQDLAGFKRAGGTEKLPRTLLIIDEFQEFFVEDDKIGQTASLLLDRIVRQGRAFGIHVLLGSQTLGGAYTVARTTLGQMVIRIALQCNEADAYLIMDDTNPAPRLLSRPGEGIYNDMAGSLEGNSPFQVVWLPDQVREKYLGKVRAFADRTGAAYPGPVVFEGNAPAEVRENAVLRGLLEGPAVAPAAVGRVWLGAPNSIKGPTEAAFERQSGNNLLVVGQNEEAILAILSIGLISLAAQYPRGGVRFILCDSTPPGSAPRAYVENVLQAIPHQVTLARQGDLPEVLNNLASELKRRADHPDPEAGPPVYLFIHSLQRYNKLRYEEDFSFAASDPDAPPNPAVLLNTLLCEGARLGIHVITTCDTYNNVSRFLSRKAFSEFEMRVLFQMSANDSASLIDNPKASTLGLHRALYYNEHEGYLETFRPYALPENQWIEQAGRHLKRLLGG